MIFKAALTFSVLCCLIFLGCPNSRSPHFVLVSFHDETGQIDVSKAQCKVFNRVESICESDVRIGENHISCKCDDESFTEDSVTGSITLQIRDSTVTFVVGSGVLRKSVLGFESVLSTGVSTFGESWSRAPMGELTGNTNDTLFYHITDEY